MLKQLAPAPPRLDTRQPTWVVFELGHHGNVLNLRELVRVAAGNAPAAAVSAAESGFARRNGAELVAIPLNELQAYKVKIHLFVSVE